MKKIKEIFLGYHKNIYVLLITWTLFGYVHRGADPYLPNYIVVLGGEEAYIGILYSVAALIQIPNLLIGGLIGDYYGRRKAVIIFTWLIALNYLAYTLAPDWSIILLGMAIGSFAGIYRPSLQAIVGDSLRSEERARGMILITQVPRFFSLPAAYIMGYIIFQYGDINPFGYRVVFLIATILAASAAIIRWFMLEETLETVDVEPIKEIIRENIRGLLGFKTLPTSTKRIILFHLIVQLGWSISNSYLIRYAFRNGIDNSTYGLYLTIASSVAIVTGLVIMPFVDDVDSRILMLIGYSLSSVGFLLFYLGGPLTILLGLVFIHTLWNLRRAGFQKYFMDSTPPAYRARAVSINGTASSISSSIGYFLASLLVIFSNENIGLLILTTAALSIVGSILIMIILPKIKEPF